MHHNRRGFVRLSGAAASLAVLGLSSGRAGAQDGPPLEVVKIVTGFPPGGKPVMMCATSSTAPCAPARPPSPSAARPAAIPEARTKLRRL